MRGLGRQSQGWRVFVSTYESAIDAKGRVSIPASFRAALGGGNRIFLWSALDGSIVPMVFFTSRGGLTVANPATTHNTESMRVGSCWHRSVARVCSFWRPAMGRSAGLEVSTAAAVAGAWRAGRRRVPQVRVGDAEVARAALARVAAALDR